MKYIDSPEKYRITDEYFLEIINLLEEIIRLLEEK
jgi:hypothetical protein